MNSFGSSSGTGAGAGGTGYAMASQYMGHPSELLGVTISTPTPIGGGVAAAITAEQQQQQWYGYPSPYFMNQWTGEWNYLPQQMYYQTNEQQSAAENEQNSGTSEPAPLPSQYVPPPPPSAPPPPPSSQYSPPPPPPSAALQPPPPLTSPHNQETHPNAFIVPLPVVPLPSTFTSLSHSTSASTSVIETPPVLVDAQLRQEEDRTRRLEAENRKKRKFPSSRQNQPQRMKKVELFAFQDLPSSSSSSDEVTPNTDSSSSAVPLSSDDSRESHPLPSSVSSSPEEILTQSQQELITKTALWITRNQEKYQSLIENSRDNERLRFLYEPASVSGRFFLKQLEKFQIERTVHEVCAGDGEDEAHEGEGDKAMSVLGGSHSQQGGGSSLISSLSREEIQRAGREAALLAMSLKRGLLATVGGSSYPTGSMEASLPAPAPTSPSPSPLPAENTTESEERKKEKRNRWGPAVASTKGSSGGGNVNESRG
jgi:hypothetical protein